MGHSDSALEEYMDAWAAARKDIIWVPSQQRYGRAASATNSDRLDSIHKGEQAVLGPGSSAPAPAPSTLGSAGASAGPIPTHPHTTHTTPTDTSPPPPARRRAEYEGAYAEMRSLAERAAKLEGKAKLVVAGLQGRSDKVAGEAVASWQQLQDSSTEVTCFQALQVRGAARAGLQPAGAELLCRLRRSRQP
jgi:hypothetical protein